jgi:acyl-[acyl carrier protein]--UDP-N-acetylglucosamine O-acyltransferase
LTRSHFSSEDIGVLQKIFRKLFVQEGAMAIKLEQAEEEYPNFAAGKLLCDFIRSSTRGVAGFGRAC